MPRAGLKAPPQGTPSTTSRNASNSFRPQNSGTELAGPLSPPGAMSTPASSARALFRSVAPRSRSSSARDDLDRSRHVVDVLGDAGGRHLDGLRVGRRSRRRTRCLGRGRGRPRCEQGHGDAESGAHGHPFRGSSNALNMSGRGSDHQFPEKRRCSADLLPDLVGPGSGSSAEEAEQALGQVVDEAEGRRVERERSQEHETGHGPAGGAAALGSREDPGAAARRAGRCRPRCGEPGRERGRGSPGGTSRATFTRAAARSNAALGVRRAAASSAASSVAVSQARVSASPAGERTRRSGQARISQCRRLSREATCASSWSKTATRSASSKPESTCSAT